MVQTRRGTRTGRFEQIAEQLRRYANTARERQAVDAFYEEFHDHGVEYEEEEEEEPAHYAQYKSTDECRRHRLPDNDSKSVQVVSYRRRKQRKHTAHV